MVFPPQAHRHDWWATSRGQAIVPAARNASVACAAADHARVNEKEDGMLLRIAGLGLAGMVVMTATATATATAAAAGALVAGTAVAAGAMRRRAKASAAWPAEHPADPPGPAPEAATDP
jgi:hypothetical protein